MEASAARAPSAAPSSSCRSTRSPSAGAGVARLDGYVVFVARRPPRRPRARGESPSASAPTPRRARSRSLEPAPDRIAPRRRPSGRAVAGAALRAPARDQAARRSTTRCGASASSTASSSSRSSPPSSSGATATSSSTPSARTRTASSCCGFHRARPLGATIDAARRLPARLRARQRGARRGARLVPRAGPVGAYDRRAHAGPAAQPRRPRGPAHRRAAGAPGHRARRLSTPTRSLAGRRRRRACSGRAPRASPRRPSAATPSSSPATARIDEELGELRFRDLARRVLPDEHRDGRACSTASPSSRGAARAGSASTTCSAASARSACRWRARAGEVWGLEIVEAAIADAIANAARQRDRPTRSFFAGDVRLALRELVEQAGRPDVVVRRPAARGPVAEDRAPHHRGGAQAHRLRLLQPDDAGAQRRAARRGRLRAAPRAPGRHVPADAAHRVRGAAGARVTKGPQLRRPAPAVAARGYQPGTKLTARWTTALHEKQKPSSEWGLVLTERAQSPTRAHPSLTSADSSSPRRGAALNAPLRQHYRSGRTAALLLCMRSGGRRGGAVTQLSICKPCYRHPSSRAPLRRHYRPERQAVVTGGRGQAT